MKWFFVFFITVSTLLSPGLLSFMAKISNPLQRKCAAQVPKTMKHQDLIAGFVCGRPLKDAATKDLLRQTSLLHLMVVSGSHLQVIAFFLLWPFSERLRKRTPLQVLLWILLFTYCFFTGFQPPVVRAFTSQLISKLNQYFSWNWDGSKIQMSSGLILLLALPEWIGSFSFYLSWLASLGFLLVPLFQKSEGTKRWVQFINSCLTCLLIQTLMAVFFSQFSFLGVVMNALFAPLLALSLMPLSLLAMAVPTCTPWVDQCWDFLLSTLAWTTRFSTASADFQSSFEKSSWHWMFLWVFLASVHCFFEIIRRHRYRGSYV